MTAATKQFSTPTDFDWEPCSNVGKRPWFIARRVNGCMEYRYDSNNRLRRFKTRENAMRAIKRDVAKARKGVR